MNKEEAEKRAHEVILEIIKAGFLPSTVGDAKTKGNAAAELIIATHSKLKEYYSKED
jgi:hypothetical protein